MKRVRDEEAPFSLDSFLDIVTNVVGVLVLVAMVTVLSAGNISVPSGATAMRAPRPSAERLLFECAGEQVFFVDEEENGQRVIEEVKWLTQRSAAPGAPSNPRSGLISRDALVTFLDTTDVGDATHRVRAEGDGSRGIAWVYTLRASARGERAADLDRPGSAFRKRLDGLGHRSFAYFVVHDDSFEIFQKARDIARAYGVSVGWHPVEGRAPVRLSALGSLGKRVQ
jgi:hypothetical protein